MLTKWPNNCIVAEEIFQLCEAPTTHKEIAMRIMKVGRGGSALPIEYHPCSKCKQMSLATDPNLIKVELRGRVTYEHVKCPTKKMS